MRTEGKLIMKTEKLYIYGTHPSTFRQYEPAEVIGMKMLTPDTCFGCPPKFPRPIIVVQHSDGTVDEIALSEVESNYEFTTLSEMGKHIKKIKD